MEAHFQAYSFVDRIDPASAFPRVRGSYAVPPQLEEFPLSLVSEAVGQLAAWSAMARLDFEWRPVAGLAGQVELLGDVRPGDILDLEAELETVEQDAIAYGGSASIRGVPVLRLAHCVGPMMPVADFDDPAALRARLGLLRTTGATPGVFPGLPILPLLAQSGEPGQSRLATLQVPLSAPFFSDHFPRRPVLPGTLLLHHQLRLATELAAELPVPAAGAGWRARRVTDVKLRTFIAPGETLEVEARFEKAAADEACVSLETRRGKRLVGGARLHLAPEVRP